MGHPNTADDRRDTIPGDLATMNVVILTLGRSGSTILSRMLEALGWHLPDADRYGEHTGFRHLNQQIIRGAKISPQACRDLVVDLGARQPWVLKDPRLVCTWVVWQRYLDRQGNLLVWLTRDLAAVERSLHRQGWGKASPRGYLLRGSTLQEAHEECGIHYAAWKGPKARIAYEDLHRAVRLFDPSRGN